MLASLPFIGPGLAGILAESAPAKVLLKPAPKWPFLPSTFPKWDAAVDGLENAGAWALEIERSRLPY